jgi:RNA polymerase sigma-70 factor (ECF subfamily)
LNTHDPERRLSSISTLWTVLRQAHEGSPEALAAQQSLMRRYGPAVRRYLLSGLRDPHVADELTQEFALALLRGTFRGADPERGRFRDYVKGVLFHLVSKYRQAQKKGVAALPPKSPTLVNVEAPAEDNDAAFNQSWREELLARTWDALADAQPTFYTVLRFRTAHPKMPSGEMAERLGAQIGRPLTAGGVRQTLRRAREMYGDLLLEEVAGSLTSADVEQVEDELRELNLLPYCRDALERYRRLGR